MDENVTQTNDTSVCPPWLLDLLRRHRDSYEPEYSGYLSDHLPMMLLAMFGLGKDRNTIESRHARYIERLDRAETNSPPDINRFEDGIGNRESYRALISYVDESILRRGVQATLTEYLPNVLSGWVRHAFHGTIRLAYGIRFKVDSEVAAGLAYLASAGPDERLAAIGQGASPSDRFAWPPSIDVTSSRFDDRYEEVMQADTFAVHTHILENNNLRVAEEVLDIFNHTQGFFALHMVTGLHALGICAEAIESDVDGIMNAGLAAAYLAIGAPMFIQRARPKPLRMDFAHEVKVAFSCFDQAKRLNSERYQDALDVYGRKFS